MKQEVTRTTLIVEAFGVSNLDIQRLVELETKIQTAMALVGTEVENEPIYGVKMEELMEWKDLMDKYYDSAVKILEDRVKAGN